MPKDTYYEGSTDTAIRISRSFTDYLHGESRPEGGARVIIRSYDLMLAFDLTEHGRQFLADWLAPQMSQRIAELEAVLAYIDAHAPLADATCNQPGITLSEAARRAIKEAQP